jgi:hypothetical protein
LLLRSLRAGESVNPDRDRMVLWEARMLEHPICEHPDCPRTRGSVVCLACWLERKVADRVMALARAEKIV